MHVAVAPTALYPGYQVHDAIAIRKALSLPVIAVGLINHPDLVSYLLESNTVDYVAIGRQLIRDPNWVMNVAKQRKKDSLIFESYKRGF